MQRESDLRRKRMFCEPLLYVSVEDSVAIISFSSGEGRASGVPVVQMRKTRLRESASREALVREARPSQAGTVGP